MTVVRDVTLQQHGNLEELKRYLSYRGIRVVGSDEKRNQLYYSMDLPCSELTANNSCRLHSSSEKPLICHKFPESPGAIEDIKNCGYRFVPSLPCQLTER